MALSQKDWREAISRAKSAKAEIANLNPRTEADLARLLGLALLRSGDRRAGLQKCEEALVTARKVNDSGVVLDANLALLEALLAVRDSAKALNVFHDLEPILAANPESRWRAFNLMARSNSQYADRAKEAIGQLESLWGHDAFQQYLMRPDLQELSRPLLQPNSAKH